jgi:DNA-binding response OmpR family regulator/anti-sigma regulatory factor (Ser/Thr protein kinase)
VTRVLVIEDEEYLCDNIAAILEFEGFEPITATDGMQGIALARRHLPDLIICDIMMPGIDGYEVLQALRSDPATSTIPFIFLTARAGREQLRQGMVLGADDYLTKPFNPDELTASVRARLERQRRFEEETRAAMQEIQLGITLALPPELDAPLNSVLGTAGRLIDRAAELTPQDIETASQTILEATRYLHREIENYLLFAQLEILRFDPARVILLRKNTLQAPGAVIESTAQQVAARQGREADLSLETHDTPVQVTHDNLRKIIEELLDNALRFSRPGTPVRVYTRTEVDGYVLHVEDRGPGIPAEVVERLRTPIGFRARLASLRQHCGLGLLVVQYLVQAHGGKLAIESTPGSGTRVQVTLLLAHTEAS